MNELRAQSTDTDRALYLALREIFSMARCTAYHYPKAGWSLYGCYTEPGDVMTKYSTDDGATIEMVSRGDHHAVTFTHRDGAPEEES